MAISVVVSLLGSPELIARHQHRYALGQHQRREHVFNLTISHFVNDGLVRGTFDTEVITEIVVVPVAVVFPVGQIVFVAVADQIVERKTIMGRDEVDTAAGRSPTRLIQVCRS